MPRLNSVHSVITMMADYNVWANERITAFCTRHPAQIIEQNTGGSFPSLKRTLLHIWDAELIWIHRLRGESLTRFPSDTWSGTPAALYDGMLNTSRDLNLLVHHLSGDELEGKLNYTTMTYGPQTSTRPEMLMHVFNHSTYHRGQCITMARALGLQDVPPTDLILYLRNNS